ncbi:peptidase associated/transthyretin-like domain-containing protein [Zavarzinella formosa]|uniref:hypothetical protein n=1 Tax=Zavarzinella formosa TaxID=360055 RepID=UPI00031B0BD2|nr:hypothetical protein [Zavarzinella formosa]
MPFAKLPMLLVSLFACALAGCATTNPNSPVEVRVTNTDTGKPVAGVPVALRYSSDKQTCPEDDSGITDRDGRVTLLAAHFLAGTTKLHVGDRSTVVEQEELLDGRTFNPRLQNGFLYEVTLTPMPVSSTSSWGLILSSDPTARSPFDDKTLRSQAGR